jgi:TPR repeat protein
MPSDPAAALECRAAAGDRQAQLDLAIRYEEGAGVPPSLKRAVRLYRSAAAPSGGTIYVYSPPVGGEKAGRVLPLNAGPGVPGLAEAQFRLALLYLEGRGVKQSDRRARALLENAAKRGHSLSADLLARLEQPERAR